MGRSFYVCHECKGGTDEYRSGYCEECEVHICDGCTDDHWTPTGSNGTNICAGTPVCFDCQLDRVDEDGVTMDACAICEENLCSLCADTHKYVCHGPRNAPVQRMKRLKKRANEDAAESEQLAKKHKKSVLEKLLDIVADLAGHVAQLERENKELTERLDSVEDELEEVGVPMSEIGEQITNQPDLTELKRDLDRAGLR